VSIYLPVFETLNASGSRYVVVGGVATVLHGHARLTADVDIILDLEAESAKSAMHALQSLGLRPRIPVDISDFADAGKRKSWIDEKGMQVFWLWDPAQPLREVDLFVAHPIDFEELWERSKVVALESTEIHIAAISDLIALKRLAGRPQDLQDIEVLEQIQELERNGAEREN